MHLIRKYCNCLIKQHSYKYNVRNRKPIGNSVFQYFNQGCFIETSLVVACTIRTHSNSQNQNNSWFVSRKKQNNGSNERQPFAFSRFSTKIDETLTQTETVTADEYNLKERLFYFAKKGDAIQAQNILKILEEKSSERSNLVCSSNSVSDPKKNNRDNDLNPLFECRCAVLDAWIKRQDDLLSDLDYDDPNEQQLRRIYEATEGAYETLKKIEYFLQQPINIKEVLSPDDRFNYESWGGENVGKIENDNNTIKNSRNQDDNKVSIGADDISNTKGFSQISARKFNEYKASSSLERCNKVLQAMANASKSSHKRRGLRFTLGLAQQALFLLNRIESLPSSADGGSFSLQIQSYNFVLESWAYSSEHLRGSNAERIFQRLLQRDDRGAKPNGETYRLMILAWCYSNQNRRAAYNATGYLMHMINELQKQHPEEEIERSSLPSQESDCNAMQPTIDDYHLIFETWVRSRANSAPFKTKIILDRMNDLYRLGKTKIKPDDKCYRHFLQTAAATAAATVNSKSNSKIGLTVSKATNLGKLVDEILMNMKEGQIIPDQTCYTCAIEVWKNCAHIIHAIDNNDHNNSSGSFDDEDTEIDHAFLLQIREECIKRAIDLLHEMAIAHYRSADVFVKPSTRNYNDVIEALSISTNPQSKLQAEKFLKAMEHTVESYQENDDKGNSNNLNSKINTTGTTDLRPDANSYHLVMKTLSNSVITSSSGDLSKNTKYAVSSGLSVLKRMTKDNLYNSIIKPRSTRDEIREVFNEFVRLCGVATSSSLSTGDDGKLTNDMANEMVFLKTALSAVQRMKVLDDDKDDIVEPNSATYLALLNAAQTKLSNDVCKSNRREQLFVKEEIFKACCDDGYIDNKILQQLRETETNLYAKLVLSINNESSIDNNEMKGSDDTLIGSKRHRFVIPAHWTRNIIHITSNSNDNGAKKSQKETLIATSYVGIDGRIRMKKNSKELKTKTLRSRVNRRLLQGSRSWLKCNQNV